MKLMQILVKSFKHDRALFKRDAGNFAAVFKKNWAFENAQLEIEEILGNMRANFLSTYEAVIRVSEIIHKRGFCKTHQMELKLTFLKATSDVRFDYFGRVLGPHHKGPCYAPPWYFDRLAYSEKPVERCSVGADCEHFRGSQIAGGCAR